MKLTGAAILVSRGMKVLQAAPAAYPYRSADQSMARKKSHQLSVAVGDTFAVPLEDGRFSACRVVRISDETGLICVASCAWIGTQVPKARNPALHRLLRLTHHKWRGNLSAAAAWVCDPPPADFIPIGNFPPTPEERAIRCRDLAGWSKFKIQPLAQWQSDHPKEAAPAVQGRQKKPLMAKEIRRLEAQIGRPLPEDYREYLLETDGGTPDPNTFMIPQIKQEASVDVFYGTGIEVRELGIFLWLEELKGTIPETWIPIGKDPGGNVILMDLSKPSKSPILYWDATRFFRQSTAKNNTYPLGKSFSDFLKKLYAEPEE